MAFPEAKKGEATGSTRDTVPRYAPNRVIVMGADTADFYPVQQYYIYPPGTAPKDCPIKPEYTVIELRTSAGSRWYGCDRAYINSELRMVVIGFPAGDAVRARWEVVPEDRRL